MSIPRDAVHDAGLSPSAKTFRFMHILAFFLALSAIAFTLVGCENGEGTTTTEQNLTDKEEQPAPAPAPAPDATVKNTTEQNLMATAFCKKMMSSGWAKRKEFRNLTDSELAAYHAASYVMYNTTTADGQRKYGLDYISIADITLAHAWSVYNLESDKGHLFGGFETFHRMMAYRVERSLRSVDPRVTLPYWDLTIDFALAGEDLDVMSKTGVFSSGKYIGSHSGDPTQLYAVTDMPGGGDGRWLVNTPGMDPDTDYTFYNDFGFFRFPMNPNPSPYITRFPRFAGMEWSAIPVNVDGDVWKTASTWDEMHTSLTAQQGHIHRIFHAWIGGTNPCGPAQSDIMSLHLGLLGSMAQQGTSNTMNTSACFQRAVACNLSSPHTTIEEACKCSYTMVGANCNNAFITNTIRQLTGGIFKQAEPVIFPMFPDRATKSKIWGMMGDMQDFNGPTDPAFMPLHAWMDTVFAKWQLKQVIDGKFTADSTMGFEEFATESHPPGHRWFDEQDLNIPWNSTNIKTRNAAGDIVHLYAGLYGAADPLRPPRLVDISLLSRLGYYTEEMAQMCDPYL